MKYRQRPTIKELYIIYTLYWLLSVWSSKSYDRVKGDKWSRSSFNDTHTLTLIDNIE